ncbi:hypothetical protein Pmani_005212 [Petrolisthes manimaculis]|uniref:Uncharacterized protein n=1 Tax=Petrolisthes manimaculis TaxID=1843537 RepID=A0AAE1QCB6_9EUCA|nr:hypothetical protein Pmani_005212 [Petrolisthes manimaculis]
MESESALLAEVRVLRQKVEALEGLQDVVQLLQEEIRELKVPLSEEKRKEPLVATIRRGVAQEWKVVDNRKKTSKVPTGIPPPTETRNSFSVLEDQCSSHVDQKMDETTPSKGLRDESGYPKLLL